MHCAGSDGWLSANFSANASFDQPFAVCGWLEFPSQYNCHKTAKLLLAWLIY